MARLPILKRLQREDFPDAPEWMDKMMYVLNTFMEGSYNAMNRSLTIADNLQGELKEFTFTTKAAYNGTAANWTALSWNRTIKAKPRACLLGQIAQLSVAGSTAPIPKYTPIEGDVCIDWAEANGVVTIGLVRGLAASTKYWMTVVLL